MDVCPRVSASG